MSTSPCVLVWCLIAVTSSTLALKQQSKSEVIRVQPGEEVNITCNGRVCGGSLQGDVVEMSMRKWTPAEGTMTVLATLTAQNLTENLYDLEITDKASKDMNITASGEEPVTLQVTTRDVQTDDVYLCMVVYQYNTVIGNVSCITRLLVTATPAVPNPTTDTTRRFTAPGHGGPPKSSPSDKQAATWSKSLMKVCVGLMAVSLALISAILVLMILIYRKHGSRDLAQQTTEKAPPPHTVEEMVSNEPIYCLLKKQ
ncbi:unnamed protein product [Lymnaea stagnalis]|uniref:Ig-like domain-containing protein n=1 Tax=Lymnaea stagnalis TaxID=6523 RepID=A0AAV2I3M6_LYMST